MAVTNPQTSVADSAAVAVSTPDGQARDVALYNLGPNTAYLGGSTVTSAAGFPLVKNAAVTLRLGEKTTLYARCATSETADVRALEVR